MPDWLGGFAGGAAGLSKTLSDQIAREQLERRQTEIERSNMATEQYRNKDLDLRRQAQADALAATAQYRTDLINERKDDNIYRRGASRVVDSVVDPSEYAQEKSVLPMSAYDTNAAIPDRTAVGQGVPESLAQNESVIKFKGIDAPGGGAGGQRSGVEINDVSMLLFDKPYSALTPDERLKVYERREQIARSLYANRNLGGKEGSFLGPIGVKDSQSTQLPVGSSAPEYAGQVIPTAQQNTRRLTANSIADQLEHIESLFPGVLPRKDEIGGLAPNLALAWRQRVSAREEYGRLQSAINNIRASLNRTIQENRGAETEHDAERALSTISQIESGLLSAITDPLAGDTLESATARIGETKQYLRGVVGTLPATPQRTTPAAAPGGPAAAPATGAGAVAPPPAAPAVDAYEEYLRRRGGGASPPNPTEAAAPTAPPAAAATPVPTPTLPLRSTDAPMTLSAAGLATLKNDREGFRDTAYSDAGTGLAIGYGMHNWQGQPVAPGLRVTREQADVEMDRQLKTEYLPILNALTVPVSQAQYDALVSVAWNHPATAKAIVAKLNRGEPVTEQDFQRSATIQGQPSEVLRGRRAQEYAPFQR